MCSVIHGDKANLLMKLINLQPHKASDDLLQLAGNPFADMFGGAPQPGVAQPAAPQNNMWMANGNGKQ